MALGAIDVSEQRQMLPLFANLCGKYESQADISYGGRERCLLPA